MGTEQGTCPDFAPNYDLILEVSGGTLTLGSSSNLLNHADYAWGSPPEVSGCIVNNGTVAATLSINTSTGAITASGVQVQTGDHIQVFLECNGTGLWPWEQRLVLRRSAFMDVPAGNSTTTFDSSHNVMPVPNYQITFGWDGSDNFKVGFHVLGDGGASQDLSCTTRRLPGQTESPTTSTIDLDTSSLQTQTAAFGKSGISGEWEIDLLLASGAGATRMEDRVRYVFTDPTQVPGYPGNFATHGVRAVQSNASGKLQVEAP